MPGWAEEIFTITQGLEGCYRDPGFDQNRVWDSGKRWQAYGNWLLPGKRDWPKFGHRCRVGEENDIRNSDEISLGSGNAGSGTQFPDPYNRAILERWLVEIRAMVDESKNHWNHPELKPLDYSPWFHLSFKDFDVVFMIDTSRRNLKGAMLRCLLSFSQERS